MLLTQFNNGSNHTLSLAMATSLETQFTPSSIHPLTDALAGSSFPALQQHGRVDVGDHHRAFLGRRAPAWAGPGNLRPGRGLRLPQSPQDTEGHVAGAASHV